MTTTPTFPKEVHGTVEPACVSAPAITGQRKWLYFNEVDPFCLEWLRKLIKAGSLGDGCIDHRSVELVEPADLAEFHEVHLFAGIGLWAKALRLADFPPDLPVWTGSCPCQPYSVAGKLEGEEDDRHLWPEMARLVAHRTPPILFGEQVAGGPGLAWCSRVRSDLEALRYAFGASDLPVASVGAPHARQRLYWGAASVAHSHETRLQILRHSVIQGSRRRLEGRTVEPPDWDAYACQWSDTNFRRIEPGLRIVADAGTEAPGRVGRIKAYGNAIQPTLAAAFIRSFTMAC